MNQRYLLTTVALFLSVLGTPSVGRTQTAKETVLASQKLPSSNVVKVGEYQSPAKKPTSSGVITQIHSHSIGGRQAATLFIRNIPVFTFTSSAIAASGETKVGTVGNRNNVNSDAVVTANTSRVASLRNVIDKSNQNDPVQRAGVVAAKINQLIQDNVDAAQITVSWKAGKKSQVNDKAQDKNSSVSQNDTYIIKVNGQEWMEMNEGIHLAGTSKNLAQDALQATNRLRRLLGNASPLTKIANLPPTNTRFSLPKVVQRMAAKINFQGIASWYGYDGSSSATASGERFHPEKLTAAHRSLPMGTKVRVTNTRNGRSVVVRINDRGPYIGGRVIDVSAGAARILGMMGSGLAPVRIDILGR
ncbi:septal ring lytic transglycosylase RlpA family protein [Cronbergia sp. UHCC 0137]|uniref:septal ring lytic transglycosylase RlpA family protein n=1 Tax=Cronbergia sp. UHCC 0137 TaxID=3110239 RepID=UPI002B21E5C4|nr:septal ring lytic transglycosylase RlpA family protein [Cronbergia sp. UHCC 0137]MEA5620379.1 septal ring lytic transglycosylase RlpA family protein [Cronbergia sp. UHCC 0137]